VFARLAGNVLARRLLQVPLFRNAFLDALSRVSEFTGGPDGWLEREILIGAEMIQSAVIEDPYRLCFDGKTINPCGPGDFEKEVETMLAFSRGRTAFVSGELAKLPLVSADTFAFGIHRRGAVRVITSNAPSMTLGASGYAELTPGTGQDLGTAGVITSSWRDGVLVGEYAVPSAALINSGHVFIEQGPDRSTEISIVNTSDQTATVTFTNAGTDDFRVRRRTLSVAAHQQWSGSLNSDPQAPELFTPRDGAIFRFESNVPVAVTSRRLRRNEFGVLTSSIAAIETETLPLNPVVLPQFAAGAGWSTEIVLLNTGTQTLEGTVAAFDPEGRRLKVAVSPGGELLQAIGYRIAARGVWRVQIVSTEGSISGSVRVSSDTQAFVPIAEAHLLFRQNGVVGALTEYTAPEPAFRHRIYMEWDPRAPGGAILSAAAIANPSNAPAEVTIELNNASGAPAGRSRILTIPPGGQRALFLWDLIGSTTGLGSFEGTVRIESTQPVAVLGLRTRTNSRGDFLFAVTPAVAEVEKPLSGRKRVVGIENGADQESQMVLVPAGEFTSSALRLFLKDGQPLRVVLH
jgi:hypothetical protein